MPCTLIKGQVLANLVAKFTEILVEERADEQNMDGKSVGMISLQEPLPWKVYVDGAANQRGSGVGLVMVSPQRIIIEKSLRLGFSATNNEAEYEAFLEGMFSDSMLVIGQVKGELEARDVRMQEYLNQARHL